MSAHVSAKKVPGHFTLSSRELAKAQSNTLMYVVAVGVHCLQLLGLICSSQVSETCVTYRLSAACLELTSTSHAAFSQIIRTAG